MKLYLKEIKNRGGLLGTPFDIISDGCLKVGNIYEGQLCPTIYNPYTLKPAPPAYVIRCDDGHWRKVDASFFLTSEEIRNEKLNELGI